MLKDLGLFVSTMLGAIPKESYLVIGTVFGAFMTLIISIIGMRGQLKLARVNHEHQYRLETQKLEHQQQVEMQKLEHQQEKERIAWFQEKLEEAMQIVLKIDMYNSITGSDITKETGISTAEWNAQYLKLDEDVRRLQMMADLYFPDLHRPVRELRGSMNVFWGYQRQLLYVDTEAFITDHLELIEKNKSFKDEAHTQAWLNILKITEEIGEKVWNVRDGLMRVARSLRQSTELSTEDLER